MSEAHPNPSMMRPLKPDVTEGPRADILHTVERVPGIHLRSIERETRLPLGQVLYHLDRLERMSLVSSLKDGGFRRYYATADIGRGEKRVLAALRHETPRRILLSLLERPDRTHKQLLASVPVAGSTLSFHLQRLVEAGVLLRDERDGAVRYSVATPDEAAKTIVAHADSFGDAALTGFAARQAGTHPEWRDATMVPS